DEAAGLEAPDDDPAPRSGSVAGTLARARPGRPVRPLPTGADAAGGGDLGGGSQRALPWTGRPDHLLRGGRRSAGPLDLGARSQPGGGPRSTVRVATAPRSGGPGRRDRRPAADGSLRDRG